MFFPLSHSASRRLIYHYVTSFVVLELLLTPAFALDGPIQDSAFRVVQHFEQKWERIQFRSQVSTGGYSGQQSERICRDR